MKFAYYNDIDANGRTGIGATETGTRPDGIGRRGPSSGCADGGFWSNAILIPCTDGKARPIEPGSFPLAHGIQRRTHKLRAYGNAIVPQVAAQFIQAFNEGT